MPTATNKDSGLGDTQQSEVNNEVDVPPEPDEDVVVAIYATPESSPEQVEAAPTSEQSLQRPASNCHDQPEDSDVSSTPTKRRRSEDDEPTSASKIESKLLENDNVDSTCQETTIAGSSTNGNGGGSKENNEVSSTYGTYEESLPDYQVDLKCAVSSCSTFDTFTTPESRKMVVAPQATPSSESSEVVSSQDMNRSIVTDSKLLFSVNNDNV